MNLDGLVPTLRESDNATTLPYKSTKHWMDKHMDDLGVASMLAKIGQQFRSNKRLAVGSGGLRVVVHVRRKNKHDNRETILHDSVVCKAMQDVRATYRDVRAITFHVHSQGKLGEFDAFQNDPSIVLHLNEPVNKTFTDMATADVLITSTSSFSYAAGLISTGAIWAPVPFWHTYPSHWHTFSTSNSSTREGNVCLRKEMNMMWAGGGPTP